MATAARAASPRPAFEDALAAQVASGRIEGALLVSRHGVPLAGTCPGIDDVDVFAAMHATALGAAEVALSRYTGPTEISLIAEMGGRRFVSRAINDQLFVVAVVTADADCKDVLDWVGQLGSVIR